MVLQSLLAHNPCPLTLNIAVKLARHATARSVSGRPDGADLGHLRGPDRIKASPTSEKTETRARKGIERFLRPTSKGGSTPDHSGLAAREPTPGPSSTGHVHHVPSTGDGKHPPADPASYTTMETTDGEARDHSIAPPMSGDADCTDLAGQDAQDCSSGHDLRDLARGSEAYDPYRTWRMELPDLECQGEAYAAHRSSSHFDDQHAEHAGGAGGVDSRSTSSGPIQVPQSLGLRLQATEGNAVDAASQHASSEAARAPADAIDICGMEPHAGKTEATYESREPTGHRFGEDIKWPFPKENIAGWLIAVRLGNDSNVCYQNSTMVAFLWAVCQLQEPCWNDFGPGAEKNSCLRELFEIMGI